MFELYDFNTIMRYGIAIILALAAILAFIYAIWGGLLMVVSGGVEDKVKAAVNHIRYAVLGIIVLTAIILVAPVLLRLINLPVYADYFSLGQIYDTVKEISAKIQGTSTDTYHDVSPTTNTKDPTFLDI